MDVQSGTALRVAITAPQFEILGSFEQSILVPADGDSTPAVFFLRPNAVGNARITLEFMQDGRYLGSVTGRISVVATAENTATVVERTPRPIHINAVSREPSLVLTVDDDLDNGRHVLTFSLSGPGSFQRFDKVVLQAEPLAEARRLFDALKQLELGVSPTAETELAVTRMLSKAAVEDLVKNIGHQLWNSFLPQQFKQQYWDKRASWKDKPLLIVSDEPYIPWELVWPYEPHPAREDPDPWCMTFRLCRWLRRDERGHGHPDIPDALSIGLGACLAPTDSGLPAAQTECRVFNDVLRWLHAKNTSPRVPTLEAVLKLLRNGDYDWLHAATHGTFSIDNPEVDAAIWLQDGYPLTPLNVTGTAIQGHIHRARPGFVFNACHGGRQSWTISGLGGWATHLISSGASVFIAPMWPVDDDDALEFTRTFYAALGRGQTIGDALRETRQQLRQSGTTAWLVYTAYADPHARLSR